MHNRCNSNWLKEIPNIYSEGRVEEQKNARPETKFACSGTGCRQSWQEKTVNEVKVFAYSSEPMPTKVKKKKKWKASSHKFFLSNFFTTEKVLR